MNNLYAVIFAGGLGSRLWPISRKRSPKQITPFLNNQTMLQRTYELVQQIVPATNILVCTNADYKAACLQQIPELKEQQLIVEPMRRNTCAAVGLAATVLNKLDPQAKMINVWSDHYIKNKNEYKEKMLLAVKSLDKYPDYLINVVIKPEYPAIGYGYLEAGELLDDGMYEARRFVEKPDLETAQQYLQAGNFYWNAAMFAWNVKTLLNLYQQYMPEMYQELMKIQTAWNTDEQEQILNEVFPQLESISVDYAIFEKAPKIALIPADLGWRDIGSWNSIYEILTTEGDNIVKRGNVETVDTEDALIFNENPDKLVTVVGMEDIVIVDTKDSLLVVKKSKDQDIKKLVKRLEEKELTEYL